MVQERRGTHWPKPKNGSCWATHQRPLTSTQWVTRSSGKLIVSRDHTFLDSESLLRSEYNIDGKRQLLAVTGSLGHSLKLVGKPSTSIEQAEKGEIERAADARKALETGRCPKCDVE